jgi:hypothetical protein
MVYNPPPYEAATMHRAGQRRALAFRRTFRRALAGIRVVP